MTYLKAFVIWKKVNCGGKTIKKAWEVGKLWANDLTNLKTL